MISYNSIGQNGRLGNQMFQYASLKGIATNRNFQYSIPPHGNGLVKYFTLSPDCVLETKIQDGVLNERFFHFDDQLFNNCPDNVDLNGYFQSYKYFDNIKNVLLEDFSFKKKYTKPFENYIAIHVRRTDYVSQQNFHPVCDISYYQQALSIINKKHPIVVVSDDIEWCKNNIGADLYSDKKQDEDLFIMMNATHNIIANSSFSWWGAWLNQNKEKIVVAPKNWFGPAYSHYNMNDIRPPEWIQI